MGKKKKQISREHAVKKREQEEERTALDGLHRLLLWLKILLIISVPGNLFFILRDGINGSDLYDLIFNLLFVALLGCSVYFHNSQKGVYSFFAYGILELLYEFLIAFLAAQKGIFQEIVGNRLFEYIFFTAIILIPVFLYYRKRMKYLKP